MSQTYSCTDGQTDTSAWEGFTPGNWCETIDVRDFIQKNYQPYEGDASFLADPTEGTKRLYNHLDKKYLFMERQKRVYNVDTDTPADVGAFGPGYISDDNNVIVGLQTDVPLKRAMMPNGGWRMVETAIREAGKEVNPEIKHISTHYHKAHNDTIFDIYTPRIRAARFSHVITGLPDVYGRGRIIGDYRRVTLYGVNKLIEEKAAVKDKVADGNFSEHWARYREEHSEQIKALKELRATATAYGFDISGPAKTVKEAVQWTYFGYLASIKFQDGATISIGRLSGPFDIYFERDFKHGILNESDAQEIIGALMIRLRIVRFLRTKAYDQIFPDDPYWAAWSDASFGNDEYVLVTKTSFRLFQALVNLGPAPEPNITISWNEKLPAGYKEFCAKVSTETSSIRYEADSQIRDHWGDNAAIACCVSPMHIGEQMQFFGVHVDATKALLYATNGGRDEMSDKQIMPDREGTADDGPLDFDEVWAEYESMLGWVIETYIKTLNIVHYCHDRYAYKAIEMALHDSDIIRTMGCNIAGLSIMADSLSAVRYAKAYPVHDKTGLIVDHRTESELPTYGNDDDHTDDIAAAVIHTIISRTKAISMYRDAIPAQSVLAITSSVVYGRDTGAFPSGHMVGTLFAPGANPENGIDTHGVLASMLSVGKLDYDDTLDGISPTSTIVPSSLGRNLDGQIRSLVGVTNARFIAKDQS